MKLVCACVLLLLLTVFSCTNREKVPGGIIGTDSMQVIMRDLIIADQFVSQYLVKDSLRHDVKKESQQLYDKLFAVHGTSREAFHKSLDFYSTRPDLEKLIFDSLSSTVTKERAAITKLNTSVRDSMARRATDSIARARSGPPPLNPDTLKKIISAAHPGLPMAVLMDSVNIRLKKRAGEDSARRIIHFRDSVARHITDSIRMKKVADSIRRRKPSAIKYLPPRPTRTPGAPPPASMK